MDFVFCKSGVLLFLHDKDTMSHKDLVPGHFILQATKKMILSKKKTKASELDQSHAPFLPLASTWQKMSKLIVYFCFRYSFEKENFLKRFAHFVLSNERVFFLTSCVFNLKPVLHK